MMLWGTASSQGLDREGSCRAHCSHPRFVGGGPLEEPNHVTQTMAVARLLAYSIETGCAGSMRHIRPLVSSKFPRHWHQPGAFRHWHLSGAQRV